MRDNHVNIVAHRGFSGEYPENTALAFREALALDVEMIEIDVHLARDESLIIVHDGTVDRTSDGTGRIADLTLAEIKRLDAGSWMDERFRNERFLTLSETLELIGDKTRLNVHIKAYDHDRDRLVPLVVRELARYDLLAGSFIASDQDSIVLSKRLQPDLAICNLSTTPGETYIHRSLSVGCTILQPGNQQVDAAFVEEAHRHDLEVNPFYADDEAEMQRLIDCGVDGILTNRPDRLKAIRG